MIVAQEALEAFGMKDEESFSKLVQSMIKDTMVELLGIEIVEITLDRVIMTMLVGPKTRQVAGILHGGASVVLAETAASWATEINIDQKRFRTVGMEINANHIRSKSDGIITATATPYHKGRSSMIWEIKITDEDGKLICISRCTMAVIARI